ncbi:FeoB-associated Cys-rich membrane protein [Tepidibacter hydrothermalis]|uniref:FeoB-associated Cys-rich membrane protein n=1 Tax=Tepidibacter hydrothermalis TaxID=3036126 RepID=A0ABY8E8T5_9FIRM|nr:FeoB-associated Cys-rich membrane protein [Tepidibacter hydrothermalis]WFD09311.1 FeoB-associated Cys-rich membrane protein [Tepidibacter hydrothermalis]
MMTFVIGGLVIGYGVYALVKTLKKEAKGECVGCSGCMSTSCSSRKDD